MSKICCCETFCYYYDVGLLLSALLVVIFLSVSLFVLSLFFIACPVKIKWLQASKISSYSSMATKVTYDGSVGVWGKKQETKGRKLSEKLCKLTSGIYLWNRDMIFDYQGALRGSL